MPDEEIKYLPPPTPDPEMVALLNKILDMNLMVVQALMYPPDGD